MATETLPAGDFEGMTVGQVKLMLEKLATDALTVAQLCDRHAYEHDSNDTGNTFRGLGMMVRSIGLMADRAIGGECVGDVGDWLVGPSFSCR